MKPHADHQKLEELLPYIRKLQELADQHGIRDVFQDNGGKLLQIALATGLTILKKREGNDAVDEKGQEYELKSVNADLTQSFSTHHHLNPAIVAKYRKVGWIFAIYQAIELKAIYYMPPAKLESFFRAWEEKWHATSRDINNPKIPLSFVCQNGELVWGNLWEVRQNRNRYQVKLGLEDL